MEYLNDKISYTEINKWMGKKVLISSQTGSGKSHFIKTKLLAYCKEHGLKMLLLSNRTILRNQNREEIGDDESLTITNYQFIENGIITSDDDLDYYLSKFDIVVADECHYFFSDSEFSRTSDLLLETLYKEYPHKMMVFMSATPEILLDFKPNFDFSYNMKRDYSYISNIFFFNKDSTPEAIVQNIPADEKIIFFSSNAEQAYELTQRFDNSSFICAESNHMYKYSSQETIDEIVNKSFFSGRLLATTKILDNGINLVDSSVKHIIVDTSDLITLIQCVGRKRVVNKDDTITLYIKNFHYGNANFMAMNIESKLQKALQLDEYGIEEFKTTHRKRSFHDIVDNDFTINKAKLQYYQYKKEFLDKIMKNRNGFKNEVIKYFQLDEEKIKDADNEFEKIGLRTYLEGIQNKFLFKEEQEEFKTRFFSLLFSPKNTNYRNRGLRSINAILEEDNLNYLVRSGKDHKGSNRNKRWWMVIRIGDNFYNKKEEV